MERTGLRRLREEFQQWIPTFKTTAFCNLGVGSKPIQPKVSYRFFQELQKYSLTICFNDQLDIFHFCSSIHLCSQNKSHGKFQGFHLFYIFPSLPFALMWANHITDTLLKGYKYLINLQYNDQKTQLLRWVTEVNKMKTRWMCFL